MYTKIELDLGTLSYMCERTLIRRYYYKYKQPISNTICEIHIEIYFDGKDETFIVKDMFSKERKFKTYKLANNYGFERVAYYKEKAQQELQEVKEYVEKRSIKNE